MKTLVLFLIKVVRDCLITYGRNINESLIIHNAVFKTMLELLLHVHVVVFTLITIKLCTTLPALEFNDV